jgi:hypothetical protein
VRLISAAFTAGAVTAVALVRSTWGLAVAVWVNLVAGYALGPAADGLARLTGADGPAGADGATGPAGEWLDAMADCAAVLAVHAAVQITFYRLATWFTAVRASRPLPG